MKIAIFGLGLVAQSDALVLGRNHDVTMTGPVPDRVDAINAGRFTLRDTMLEGFLASNRLSISATLNAHAAIEEADMILVSAPLAFSKQGDAPCTAELESRIEFAHARAPGIPIVIRSAVPVGFTERMRTRLGSNTLVYVPEFVREGQALKDALNPRLLIVGDRGPLGSRLSALLLSAIAARGVPTKLVGSSEAEAIKHFSQAYLALRVGYFNELDSYAMTHDLVARQVIDGICLDPRIGRGANNPCFGVGGERLRRSTLQMRATSHGAPTSLLPMMMQANETRLSLLTSAILAGGAQRIGLYDTEADGNSSVMADLHSRLERAGATVVRYKQNEDLAGFGAGCDIIVAQRKTKDLLPFEHKLFCRDHFAQ